MEVEKGGASASGAANLDRMDNPLHHLNAFGFLDWIAFAAKVKTP
ncbi:hypothetical protein OAF50_02350 [bacterium]|jgi:hypothetical protein|nr:hypothetical protein [bacterium]